MPINIRKLAALDMAFLGSRMILAEFALGVVGPLAVGIYSLAREHSRQQVIIGAYLVLLGINYIPLLMYAVAIYRKRSAQDEVADELAQRTKIAAKYFPQTLLLLIPLVVPFLAVSQELHRRKSAALN